MDPKKKLAATVYGYCRFDTHASWLEIQYYDYYFPAGVRRSSPEALEASIPEMPIWNFRCDYWRLMLFCENMQYGVIDGNVSSWFIHLAFSTCSFSFLLFSYFFRYHNMTYEHKWAACQPNLWHFNLKIGDTSVGKKLKKALTQKMWGKNVQNALKTVLTTLLMIADLHVVISFCSESFILLDTTIKGGGCH